MAPITSGLPAQPPCSQLTTNGLAVLSRATLLSGHSPSPTNGHLLTGMPFHSPLVLAAKRHSFYKPLLRRLPGPSLTSRHVADAASLLCLLVPEGQEGRAGGGALEP